MAAVSARRGRAAVLTAALAASIAAGCTVGGNLSDPPDPALAQRYLDGLRAPVAQIEAMELGRTRDGFALSVFGRVPTVGWSAPQLRPRDPAVSADGMLEYDFVAVPPQGVEPRPGPVRIRADRAFPADAAAQARGVRIWSAEGAAEGLF
ncbi:MAG: hypothetical protein ACFCUS_02705 [Rubrimonas sp.]|uniref:hypothetical protein n=1 Tax=Rubrimonas sp. TaxID=2036015 RepID=UPI002FDD9D23